MSTIKQEQHHSPFDSLKKKNIIIVDQSLVMSKMPDDGGRSDKTPTLCNLTHNQNYSWQNFKRTEHLNN